jgi:hypothetical protein
VKQPEDKAPDNNTASCKEVNGDGSCSSASDKTDASTVISLDKEENFKAASSGLPMQSSEKPNASVGSSLNKASSGASMQVEGVRHIKYTFNRRKRKCVSMDSTPCAVPEKSSDLLSAPKEGETHPNAEPQVNLIDSTQDDNQLIQVAQQVCNNHVKTYDSTSNQLSTCYITISLVSAAHFVVRAQLTRVLQ